MIRYNNTLPTIISLSPEIHTFHGFLLSRDTLSVVSRYGAPLTRYRIVLNTDSHYIVKICNKMLLIAFLNCYNLFSHRLPRVLLYEWTTTVTNNQTKQTSIVERTSRSNKVCITTVCIMYHYSMYHYSMHHYSMHHYSMHHYSMYHYSTHHYGMYCCSM